MAKKEEAAARALFAAGKDAAKRALEELGLSEEEKAIRAEERAREKKLRRYKWIAIGAFAFILVLAVVFLIAKIWMWVLLLALLAGGGYLAYRWAKAKLTGPPEIEVVQAKAVPAPRAEPKPAAPIAALPPKRDAEDEAARIERELAALKKKIEK